MRLRAENQEPRECRICSGRTCRGESKPLRERCIGIFCLPFKSLAFAARHFNQKSNHSQVSYCLAKDQTRSNEMKFSKARLTSRFVCATLFLSATTLGTVEASASRCETYTISRIEFLKHPRYACDVKIMRLQIPGPGDALKAEYHST